MSRDTLTGCPERRLEPMGRKDQNRINYLRDLSDAEFEIKSFLDDYKTLFPEEIKSFLIDIRFRVQDEMEEG